MFFLVWPLMWSKITSIQVIYCVYILTKGTVLCSYNMSHSLSYLSCFNFQNSSVSIYGLCECNMTAVLYCKTTCSLVFVCKRDNVCPVTNDIESGGKIRTSSSLVLPYIYTGQCVFQPHISW